MEKILQLDSDLLLFINSHHTPFWDQVLWYATQSWVWIPLYLLMIYVIWKLATGIKFEQKRERYIALIVLLAIAAIGLAAGLSDFVTSGILKKWICRPRPTHSAIAHSLHILHGYAGGKYGFPSSHAANTFAVATAYVMIVKRLRRTHHTFAVNKYSQITSVRILNAVMTLLVISYVLLNCYSRMYLGVHYPLDILCGAAIGLLFGWLFGLLFSRSIRPFVGPPYENIRIW